VQYVQTKGGVAPPSGCDAAYVRAEARVPYTARRIDSRRAPLDGRLGWQSPRRKAWRRDPGFTTHLAVRGGQQA